MGALLREGGREGEREGRREGGRERELTVCSIAIRLMVIAVYSISYRVVLRL